MTEALRAAAQPIAAQSAPLSSVPAQPEVIKATPAPAPVVAPQTEGSSSTGVLPGNDEPSEPASVAMTATAPASPGSDDTNVWPTAAEEASFLAETRVRGEPVAPRPPAEVEEESDAKALPPLEQLVNRIPAEARELLDELFRAKFTTVRRVKKSDLKS